VVGKVNVKTIKLLFMTCATAGLTTFTFIVIRSVHMEKFILDLHSVLPFISTGAVPIMIFLNVRKLPSKNTMLPSIPFAIIYLTSFISLTCFTIAYILMYIAVFIELDYNLGPVAMVVGAYCMCKITTLFILHAPSTDEKES